MNTSHLVLAALLGLLPNWLHPTRSTVRFTCKKAIQQVFFPKRSVAARFAGKAQIVAVTRSGPNGHFTLENLPAGRVVLTASRSGYYTRLAAGRAASEIRLDCTAGCAYSDLDFELVRGAVVTGSVADALGEPSKALVSRWSAKPRPALREDGLRETLPMTAAYFGSLAWKKASI